MELSKAIDTMVQLEQSMSDCYKAISLICQDEENSKELTVLAKEEIDHKNLLTAGINYLMQAPDLFAQKREGAGELSLMANRIATLISNIHSKKVGFMEAINDVAAIERQLERFHMNRIAEVKDDSLRKLLNALSLGDKEHTKRLLRILQGSAAA